MLQVLRNEENEEYCAGFVVGEQPAFLLVSEVLAEVLEDASVRSFLISLPAGSWSWKKSSNEANQA